MAGFVDEAQAHVRAGDGGAGAVSFRREAHVARGGPDGGDGGAGGDVWMVASGARSSLMAFRDHPFRRAQDGTHGQGKGRHGVAGADCTVEVPAGTVVRAKDGTVLVDLVTPGDAWLAAAGGRGGQGNARFLSNRRRAPSFAEQGERGEEHWLGLELKLMADVALVGFPNAGKSTLISRISAAKPKIADYPFTTLEPLLGVVRSPDGSGDMVVADVPGLVEGASEGRGLGQRFLRHVERARVLLVLVDLSPSEGRSPQLQERVLLEELSRYRPSLLDRPRLVVGSRLDLADRAVLPGRAGGPDAASGPGAGSGRERPAISSVTGDGVGELLGELFRLVAAARAAEPSARAPVVHRPAPRSFEVLRAADGAWVVKGRVAERAVALHDLSNPEALAWAQTRLRRLGVDRALARAGARGGDQVRIGGHDLTWEEG